MVSWTEHLSARELGVWRIVGMLLFYGVSFTVRPWRLLQLVRNVLSRRQESVLDRAMIDFGRRALGLRRTAPPPAAPELGAVTTR